MMSRALSCAIVLSVGQFGVLSFFTAYGQTLPCYELNLQTTGDSAAIATDPAVVRVRAHRPPATMDAVCVSAAREGFYRILAGVTYSTGQTNESFFLQV